MSITPEALEHEFTLTTAATRLDFLSRRDNGDTALNTVAQDDDDHWHSLRATETQLDVHESLELLALGEVVARKAHDSRLVGIRAALRGGASWEQIAEALGSTPQRAWDDFNAAVGAELEADAAASVRELAGARPAR
jgi:alkylhydroperoxidase/carboxymuconolactone decarboxylase family protein YurZ